MKISWKNIENWRSWKMSFFWGGHFEFSKSAILIFFCFISVNNPALLYEVTFFSSIWMVFSESWKRSCSNFNAHDCNIWMVPNKWKLKPKANQLNSPTRQHVCAQIPKTMGHKDINVYIYLLNSLFLIYPRIYSWRLYVNVIGFWMVILLAYIHYTFWNSLMTFNWKQ